MQLLYHCNVGAAVPGGGQPGDGPGPREWPRSTPRAAEGIDTFDTYAGPAAGFRGAGLRLRSARRRRGHTLAMLYHRGRRSRPGAALRTAASCPASPSGRTRTALEDGYVTGTGAGVPTIPTSSASSGSRDGCGAAAGRAGSAPGASRCTTPRRALITCWPRSRRCKRSAWRTVHRSPQARFSAV